MHIGVVVEARTVQVQKGWLLCSESSGGGANHRCLPVICKARKGWSALPQQDVWALRLLIMAYAFMLYALPQYAKTCCNAALVTVKCTRASA